MHTCYNFRMRKFLHKVVQHFIPSHHNAYRPHVLKKPWLIFFLTMVLTAETILVAGSILKHTGIDFLAAVVPSEVIAFTNIQRANTHLSLVEESSTLSAAAQAKAEDMARKGYFAHVGPDGKEPWKWIAEAGYQYIYAGENLAVRFVESSQVVEAWMASPTHRANIVKPVYEEIGVGVAEGTYEGQPAIYVVQYFGTPRVDTSPVVAVASPPQVEEAGLQETVAEQVDSSVQGATVTAPPTTIVPIAIENRVSTEAYVRPVVEGLAQADTPAMWLIGGIALLLVMALMLAFFIHLQVQPTDMLMGGATVALIAISLFTLNKYYLPDSLTPTNQSASVSMAGVAPEGIIDDAAVSYEHDI